MGHGAGFEVTWWCGRNGINLQSNGVLSHGHCFGGAIMANLNQSFQSALGRADVGFDHGAAFGDGERHTFARGAIDVDASDALADQMLGDGRHEICIE